MDKDKTSGCGGLSRIGKQPFKKEIDGVWKERTLFTHVAFADSEAQDMKISKTKLQQLGFALVARLWALSECE